MWLWNVWLYSIEQTSFACHTETTVNLKITFLFILLPNRGTFPDTFPGQVMECLYWSMLSVASVHLMTHWSLLAILLCDFLLPCFISCYVAFYLLFFPGEFVLYGGPCDLQSLVGTLIYSCLSLLHILFLSSIKFWFLFFCFSNVLKIIQTLHLAFCSHLP